MSVGDTFNGTRSTSTDDDWIRITLEAGETYNIAMNGSGAFDDTYLYLRDASGNIIQQDDDGGPGLYSNITFTASYSGTYFIQASAFSGEPDTGAYTVAVRSTQPPTPTEPGTLDELADFLTDGYWESTGRSGRSFDTDGSNVITVNITGLTAAGQQLARWAFETWEMVADLEFVETTSSGAMITFDDEDPGRGVPASEASAFAVSTTNSSGDILSSEVVVTQAWVNFYGDTIDSYSFTTYVHEIGHALGLGHQGAYNGNATYGADQTFANDSWQVSIMSYFDQDQNTTTNASRALQATTMIADILAIQNLYGASETTNGNTTWGGRNSNIGTYLDTVFAMIAGASGPSSWYTGDDMAFTIYDNGGTDLVDLSFSTTNDYINLAPTTGLDTFWNVGGLIGNIAVAQGTVLENLEAGSGNDRILGNAANNVINGNNGNDTIFGQDGADTIGGGLGDDSVEGNAGNDNIDGGAGNDALWGGLGNDSIVGGTGADTLGGADGSDTVFGGDQNDLIFGGAGDDTLNGEQGNDTLWAGIGNDSVIGFNGNDLMGGAAGNDTMVAGAGNDTVYGGAGADQIYGADGNDVLFSGDQNDLIFGGNGADIIGGGNGADTVFGGAGNDQIAESDGNDQLDGGAGEDTMFGGNGDDVVIGGADSDALSGNAGNDTIFGGTGNDRIFAGTGADSIFGGDQNDVIYGGDGNDTINGDSGNDQIFGGNDNDVINGGAGDDSIYGGAGDDTFIFGSGDGDDVIFDFNAAEDQLVLDDALWSGTLTTQQVVDTYGSIVNGSIVLSFDNGESITLDGLGTLAGLEDSLNIV
ncbi:pre-peptidase C-terminal domain-containing protein [Pseudaestuariivita rosea]|uniref:pre-peptidase C-terminal domain-containing protein n=1 Tax=Pseudaestuariivita rosea TaxID=2763263 RepID=UPI001ABB5734|nr:M10 family metallopeptidase C-terminal domain-containing protein [Pseudaestuariivita rosea]